MAARIKGRVSEHGNPGKLESVQYGLGGIPPSAASSGNSLLVDMKLEPVQSGVFYRGNGIIGTDHGAHGTPDTGIFHPGFLLYAIERVILVGMAFILFNRCFNDSFLEHRKFNGLDRADSGTLAAQGAPVIVILNLPWQIIKA